MNVPSKITHPDPESVITTTRVVQAGTGLAFQAWTDPAHLKNWWGPEGFTNTFHEHDLRPGGKWSFIMHGPDGANYPNECIFIEVNSPRFVAWDHLSNPVFQVQTSFEAAGDQRTKITFAMLFSDKEECQRLRSFILEKNEENMDKLEAELQRMKG